MPVLPVQRSTGVARRKRAGSIQPSAADVDIVSPTRDPGITLPPAIQAPEGAFKSTIGIAAEELTPAFLSSQYRLITATSWRS